MEGVAYDAARGAWEMPNNQLFPPNMLPGLNMPPLPQMNPFQPQHGGGGGAAAAAGIQPMETGMDGMANAGAAAMNNGNRAPDAGYYRTLNMNEL